MNKYEIMAEIRAFIGDIAKFIYCAGFIIFFPFIWLDSFIRHLWKNIKIWHGIRKRCKAEGKTKKETDKAAWDFINPIGN
jgi:hypothetical protein